MAGGYGLRLGPLTREIPKPLAPLSGAPILDHVLAHLARHGFHHVAISLHYLAEKIETHLANAPAAVAGAPPLELRCSISKDNLGSAGGARRAARFVEGDPILIVSGDVVMNLDLDRLMRVHEEKGAALTALAIRVDDPSEFGLIELDDDGRMVSLKEKPTEPPAGPAWVNAGAYVITRRALEMIPPRRPYDFAMDLIPKLLRQGEPVFVDPQRGVWFDIGTPESLSEAERFFREAGIKGPRLAERGVGMRAFKTKPGERRPAGESYPWNRE